MRVQHRGHDLGGILEREVAGARAQWRRAEMCELPFLRLMQRREPRPRDVAAGYGLRLASNHRVDDELRGQVAARRRDDGGTDRELAIQPDAILEFLAADDFQTAQRGGRRVETSGGGTDESVSSERCEIVHNYSNHLPVISRERRYMAVASSGRLSRSSTLPMPYSALGLAGCSSTAFSYAASAPFRSST